MTEAEWLRCVDPEPMLAALDGKKGKGQASARKLRLLACSCCRRIWDLLEERSWEAIETAEAFADGQITGDRLETAHSGALAAGQDAHGAWEKADWTNAAYLNGRHLATGAVEMACSPTWSARNATEAAGLAIEAADCGRDASQKAERKKQAALVRDLFRPPSSAPLVIPPSLLAWNGGALVGLAAAAYAERSLPEGTLDPARLAVLADALLDAGCDDREVLAHFRQKKPVHVRGCFVLDAVLGKA
jgi:hypothetical protein